MLILMFIMLKKITIVFNEKSKAYFIDRIQVYDEVIESKSIKLDEITKKIKELEKIGNIKSKEKKASIPDISYDISSPSYRNEEIFSEFKKIDNEFNINNTEIIKKFIDEKVERNDLLLYEKLIDIKLKLNFNNIYEISILDSKKQMDSIKNILEKKEQFILESYSKEEFNILEFINFLDELIRKEDPTIYVRVGDKNQNYDTMDNLIKTVYDEKICKGVLIIYKNNLYDYSLS